MKLFLKNKLTITERVAGAILSLLTTGPPPGGGGWGTGESEGVGEGKG